MKNQLDFNKFAMTLAALGTVGLSAGAASASPLTADSPLTAEETGDAVELGGKKDGKSDEDDKKKKKDGGGKGGCGAGTCG